VLLQSNRNNQAPWSSVAEGVDTQIPVPLKDNNAWLGHLAGEDRAYLSEELFVLPEWQDAPDTVRRHIAGLDIKVFLPLRHKEELTGLLLLGAKSSRRGYTLEELDLLEAVALHAASAMANARLYEELRLQLQELKETQAQLVQSGKLASVGTLAAGVAHEVNNPVFAITGMAEILLSNPERHLKSDQAQECLSVIVEMANRIASVVQGMLVYSRNDNIATPVNLNEVADATLRLMEHKLRSGGVEVIRDYRPDLPYVLAVSNRLQQALMNLILNASDAMGKSGTLTLSTGVDDGLAWISCRDTGSGISPQDLERIFDAFFTTKPVGKGTGLGLHITHRIVEDCGGEIRVESEEGVGTTFTICLPIAAIEDDDLEFYDHLPGPKESTQSTAELLPGPHQVAAGLERDFTV
jgi:signal transduction histidine kinase